MPSVKKPKGKELPREVLDLLNRELTGEQRDARSEEVRQHLRKKCQADLWYFAYHACGFKDIVNELHVGMCERWTARLKRAFSLWLIPRSHLKTSLWTIAASLWELVRNPDQRILVVSARLDNAIDMLRDVESIISTNEVFRWLFPEYCYDLAPKALSRRCKVLTTRIDVPCSKYAGRKEGNIEVMSVGANLTSKHYDLMLFDDPVNEDNTTTKEFRDKIWKWYRNALQLRDNPITSRVRIIGTRWHFDDLYARIIKREHKRRQHQKENGIPVKPVYLIYRRKAVEQGKPIWPERFTLEELHRLKTEELGSYIYSCQYDNNPLPEEDAYFKEADLQEIEDLEIPDVLSNFMAVDLADEDTTRGDMTVITVASFDEDSNMYVREIIRGRLSLLDVLDEIWRLQQKWKTARVGIETTAFQKAIYRNYKRIAGERGWSIPWVEMERGKTSKFKRTLGLQPRVERKDFFYESGIHNADWMIEEMITFPLGAHDDILDTIVDLENLYYAAPREIVETVQPDTYDAYYGKLDEDYLGEAMIPESSRLVDEPYLWGSVA